MRTGFDVIVLGMGAMGAAATYQLAKRGARVLGIDQYDPPHKFGSTHGESRITRVACGEGPMYTAFARRSHEIWPEVEGELGPEWHEKLFKQNGLIVIGGPNSETAHDAEDFLEETVRIAKEARIPFETLDAQAIRRRFPFFAVQNDETAYLDRVGGLVNPEACVAAQLTLARNHGAMTNVNETVRGFEQTDGGVRVATDKGVYEADRLIVAAGPWLPELLDGAHAPLFKVTRQVLFWFAVESEQELEALKADRFPVFIWTVPKLPFVYGFPALGTRLDGVKIATSQAIDMTSPSTVSRTVTDAEKKEMYETYVRPFFPMLTNECTHAEVCLYTKVDDSLFVIDRHPSMNRVILVSACSGHGFKHSAGIGELLAKMALGEKHQDIAAFSLEKYRKGA
jgi:sarcosine oxidase